MPGLMATESQSRLLAGWGNTAPSRARVDTLTRSRARDLLASVGHQGVIMRGLGRAYGDAAQNGGGLVLDLAEDTDGIVLDSERGVVRCSAGLSLDHVIAHLVPRGFFVPVTPGTRFVTVGGAVASDIHGKNHHVDGSFGSHVESLTLLLADGSIVEVGPEDGDLFWATVGGMGLTGAILDVTFRLLRIETSRCTVSTQRCSDLESLLAAMSDHDEEYRYSVAWTDLLSTGRSLGRGILWRGDHTRLDELGGTDSDPLEYVTRSLGSVPNIVPAPGLVNKLTSTLFNELWYRKAPRSRQGEIKSIPAYFHPLDAVGHWNRLYGPHGFLQYQFLVPFGQEEALRRIVSDISKAGCATPLVVLKRFGEGNRGLLSFPAPGWTLTVDIAARLEGLGALLRGFDEIVLAAGGRHYLAKDSHMSPDTLARGYPRLEEWKSIKNRVDPNGMWSSDLARRLELSK